MIDYLASLSPAARIAAILVVVAIVHLIVRLVQSLAENLLRPAFAGKQTLAVRYPKITTVLSLLASALTFVLYFAALGLVLAEFGVSLTAYFASATIIGLAVGFGSQGLVQDVVTGLTLIFSNAMNVGDVVDLSGQIGRVQSVGLRFTVITNVLGQRVLIPNRNIGVIGRYRGGSIRAYVDVQVPDGTSPEEVENQVMRLAEALRGQHSALIGPVESLGVQKAGEDGWRYLRIKLRVWPGQQTLIENVFRQRLLASLRQLNTAYADWMVVVTYRATRN